MSNENTMTCNDQIDEVLMNALYTMVDRGLLKCDKKKLKLLFDDVESNSKGRKYITLDKIGKKMYFVLSSVKGKSFCESYNIINKKRKILEHKLHINCK